MTIELVDALKHARHQQHNQHDALEQMHKATHDQFMRDLAINITHATAHIRTHLVVEQEHATIALAQFKTDLKSSWPLKTNKMSEFIIPECYRFFDSPDGEKLITSPHISQDISLGASLPYLNGLNRDTFWGTSKPTYLAAELTFAYMSLKPLCSPIESIASFSLQSPFHHVVPYDTKGLPHIGSKLLYDVKGQKGYGFIHSGFAFGGNRGQESLYPEGKPFAPCDASSLVKEWTLPKDAPDWAKVGASTLDLTYAVKPGLVVDDKYSNWLGGAHGILPFKYQELLSLEDVRPGDILLMRKNCSHDNPLGISGHVGIITNTKGTFDPGQIEILTANRDMPHIEGVGLQHVHKLITMNTNGTHDKVMYLRPVNTEVLPEPFFVEDICRSVDEQPHQFVSVFGDIAEVAE